MLRPPKEELNKDLFLKNKNKLCSGLLMRANLAALALLFCDAALACAYIYIYTYTYICIYIIHTCMYRSLGVVSDKIASAKRNPVQTGTTTTTPPTTTTTTTTNNNNDKGR